MKSLRWIFDLLARLTFNGVTLFLSIDDNDRLGVALFALGLGS